MPYLPNPKKNKTVTTTTITNASAPVASTSKGRKIPKVVQSKDANFDWEVEGAQDQDQEDRIQNKIKLGLESTEGLLIFTLTLL